jgi:hypothetical protein
LSNYKFYAKKVCNFTGITEYDFSASVTKFLNGRDDDFISSSPCIIPHSEGYLLNVRYVNYRIHDNGSYTFKHYDNKITTLNKVYWLNKRMEVLKSSWMDKVHDESMRYQGVEDVKIFSHCGDLLFLGTVQNPQNSKITIGGGDYNPSADRLMPRVFESPLDRDCEKNWCYFHTGAGDLRIIYEWSPLTVATLGTDTKPIILTRKQMPPLFTNVRGSSNGCLYGDEIWFLCHIVQYSTPRHYYHILVILDAKTLEYKRHSIMFKFHGECIEYSLGLIVETDRLIMSYSRMDRTSHIICIPRDTVEKELFHG